MHDIPDLFCRFRELELEPEAILQFANKYGTMGETSFVIGIGRDTPKPSVLIDVEELVESFKTGIGRFINDVSADPAMQTKVEAKASRFFRSGLLIGPR